MDDLHLIVNVSGSFNNPRRGLFEAALAAVLDHPKGKNKKLAFAFADDAPDSIRARAQTCKVDMFARADYTTICRFYLAATPNVWTIPRCIDAPALNAHQLRTACLRLSSNDNLDTEEFIDHRASQNLASNVEIKEVEQVDWNDLRGVDGPDRGPGGKDRLVA